MAKNTQSEVKQAPIQVDNEWAELKECIYGAPHDFVFSKWLSDAACRPWGEFRDFWMANQGKSLRDVDKERFDRLMGQVQGAIDFLRAQGVIVHLPVPHTERNMEFPRGENHGCLTAWMRDPFVTIDNNVIELAPRSMFHRRQRFPIRSILASTMERVTTSDSASEIPIARNTFRHVCANTSAVKTGIIDHLWLLSIVN